MNHEEEPARVPEEDRPEGEDLWQSRGAERGVWSEAMLVALDKKRDEGSKWFSLIDKVASERTLGIAWEKVADNAGACGVDRVTTGRFAKDSHKRLLAVKEHLSKGDYQPHAIRRVEIPKAGSKEKRPLGIPTVRDRVVQGALRMVMEPIFEREFAASSYGFRPGRGCRDALREVERLLESGHHHIVDIDIKGYFDNIPHNALLELVKERVADGKVLGLVEAFLKQGILENGREIEAEKGSPQGGLISPLLANIYLNPLDWLLAECGLNCIRYADDIIVLAREAGEAAAALEKISRWMDAAGLQLHPKKTRLVDMAQPDAHFDYLGYRFKRGKGGRLMKLVRPKSKAKLRESLKKSTKRCNAHSLESIITKVNRPLKGWYGYFKHARQNELREMDGWLRMRLRSILRKRRKGKGRGRGSDHQRWPNRYLEELGLFSLEQAKVIETSLLKRAKC